MGFSNSDRLALGEADDHTEEQLDGLTIERCGSRYAPFLYPNFWYMWQTTFALPEMVQPV